MALQFGGISCLVLLALSFVACQDSANTTPLDGNITKTCLQIRDVISSTALVSFPGSQAYVNDISHGFNSSSQFSVCSVEPATVEDVPKIMKIIGKNRTPFAVKSGGHALNVGYSSTNGVQIALTKLNKITPNVAAGTVDIGTGLLWEQVYSALTPFNRTVVGGRVPGVGVGGFSLGGGLSWLSNQRGLTIDNLISAQIVLPNGQITTASSNNNPDLLQGLRGGFNNFGIVTRLTLKMFPQGRVWGGLIVYNGDKQSQIAAAASTFATTNTDPKAQMIAIITNSDGTTGCAVNLFYDGTQPPSGIFDTFLTIPNNSSNVNVYSYADFIQSLFIPTDAIRSAFHTAAVTNWSQSISAQIVNLTNTYGILGLSRSGVVTALTIEPFLPSYFSFAGANPSLYPRTPLLPLQPLGINLAWADASDDSFFQKAIHDIANTVVAQAVSEGQNVGGANQIKYNNYAIADTPLKNVYGNLLPTGHRIAQKYDPTRIMTLTGGWKLQ